MDSWDLNKPGELYEKLRYWVDYWEHTNEILRSKQYSASLISPRVIIDELIDTIDQNQIQNDHNAQYFQSQLDDMTQFDTKVGGTIVVELQLIKKELQSNRSREYVLALCREIGNVFSEGKYFRQCCHILSGLLIGESPLSSVKDAVESISEIISIDLIMKGYSPRTIGKMAGNLFRHYEVQEGHIFTYFPHRTEWPHHIEDRDLANETYTAELSAEMDALSVEDRLERLVHYYYAKPSRNYYLYQIIGVTGDIDIKIGSVNFYSPQSKRYITKPAWGHGDELLDPEAELFDKKRESFSVNAAVLVESVDREAGELQALAAIERATDLLRLYFPSPGRYQIDDERYLLADEYGAEAGGGFGGTDTSELFTRHFSLDLSSDTSLLVLKDAPINKVSDFISLSVESMARLERQIVQSLHWYRKAEDTNIFEDKLINYWVAMESIIRVDNPGYKANNDRKDRVTKFSFVFDYIPLVEIGYVRINRAMSLYSYLYRMIHHGHFGNKLVLPDDLVQKSNLDVWHGNPKNLTEFISNIPRIASSIDSRILRDTMASTHNFYADPQYTLRELVDYQKMTENDLVTIYRYRNKIVHDAHFYGTLLPYYSEKLRHLCHRVLTTTIMDYTTRNMHTAEEILLARAAQTNRLLESLKKGRHVDLLEV